MRHPSAFYIGDQALVPDGPRDAKVTIVAFKGHLVVCEFPDGIRRSRRLSDLRPR